MATQQRAALVTGAAGGIGRAIACALAASGHRVAIADVDQAGLEGTAAAARGDCEQLVLDVTDSAAVGAAVDRVCDRLGVPHVVVNAAGVSTMALLVDLSERDWDAVMAVNIRGTFFLTQQVGRHLIAAGSGGCVVNIASTHALAGTAERSTYGISKAALVGMTRMLAVEWAEYGIRVNAIAPGRLETPSPSRAEKGADRGYMDTMLERIPLHRLASAEEVAATVAYLVSPAAASMTGQVLVLDGGLTAA